MKKLLAVLFILGLAVGCSRTPLPPNLLLVTIDTLRADRLGCYGHPGARTPVLDRLGEEGFVFRDILSPAPLTLPAHASILTGLNPPAHGLRDNGAGILPASLPTLGEILAARGWKTGAVVSSLVLDARFGLARGFSDYLDLGGNGSNQLFRFREIPAAEASDRALDWLEEAPQPFFLWLHYFDPHADYLPPEPFKSEFAENPYDGEIAYVDRELGRVFQRLREQGRWENTLVAVTSDHGEGLGDHGEPTHGLFLYQATLRVPLILRGPGIEPGESSAPGALIDLLPTLLGLLGLPLPAGIEGADLSGRLRGEKSAPRDIYFETLAPNLNFGWSALKGARGGRWKYIRAPRPELYNLEKDPGENLNLFSQLPDFARKLELSLRRLERERENPSRPGPVLDPRDREALYALGYGSGGGGADSGIGADPKDMVGLLPLLSRNESELRRDDLAGALATLSEILKLDPGNLVAWERTVLIYRRQGRPRQALQALDRCRDLAPPRLDLVQTRASLLLETGEREEAAREIQRGLALFGSDPFLLVLEGKIRRGAGELEAARACFLRALEKNPDYLPALVNLADYHCRLQEWERAGEILEDLRRRFPDDPEASYNLGIYRLLRDQPAEAAACFRRTLCLNPGHRGARERMEAITAPPAETPGAPVLNGL